MEKIYDYNESMSEKYLGEEDVQSLKSENPINDIHINVNLTGNVAYSAYSIYWPFTRKRKNG